MWCSSQPHHFALTPCTHVRSMRYRLPAMTQHIDQRGHSRRRGCPRDNMCHPSPERRVRVALSCPGAYVARGRGSAYVVASSTTVVWLVCANWSIQRKTDPLGAPKWRRWRDNSSITSESRCYRRIMGPSGSDMINIYIYIERASVLLMWLHRSVREVVCKTML